MKILRPVNVVKQKRKESFKFKEGVKGVKRRTLINAVCSFFQKKMRSREGGAGRSSPFCFQMIRKKKFPSSLQPLKLFLSPLLAFFKPSLKPSFQFRSLSRGFSSPP